MPSSFIDETVPSFQLHKKMMIYKIRGERGMEAWYVSKCIRVKFIIGDELLFFMRTMNLLEIG